MCWWVRSNTNRYKTLTSLSSVVFVSRFPSESRSFFPVPTSTDLGDQIPTLDTHTQHTHIDQHKHTPELLPMSSLPGYLVLGILCKATYHGLSRACAKRFHEGRNVGKVLFHPGQLLIPKGQQSLL